MKAVGLHILCCFFILLFSNLVPAKASVISTSVDSLLSKYPVEKITLIGNKNTKDHILFRELTFKKGDSLDTVSCIALFKRSEENLYNTSLFNSVHINWVVENKMMQVYIIVTERWYIFPLPILEIAERNFNVWWQTKDYSRLVYGGVLNWNNFRGRNETLAITARLGYTQRLSFYYSIPYINRGQRSGLTFGFALSRNHQSSVESLNNKVIYFKDTEKFARKELGASVAYSYRPDLYHTHVIETGFKHAEVLDTVIALNADYFTTGQSKINYSVLRYFFKSDHRDIAVYPLKGYYIDFEIVKNGFRFLNDDIDMAYISAEGKKFWPLANRLYFGAGISTKYSTGTGQPYFLSRGLGYGKDYLRGYEYYVMDGQNYALLKSNFKIELLPKREVYAAFVPMRKFSTIPYAFYLNLYSDCGYVKDYRFQANNPLVNSLQIGYGGGIDFVTYYDMVFRFEYSFNKLGESGFFLHFTSPI